MAVRVSGLRRNIKNVAHNYTDAQVKVREATSNDPWGPSSTQMSEISDLTYNVVAFSEIMSMIWKRLNDNGKNWRHVYKSLVLLEYLIKTGSEKVAQQSKENIFHIQTLKDFQYLDLNKDQGINVREKAKTVVALLKDDERLRSERVRALKAKERFAQSTAGIGSDTVYNYNRERFENGNQHSTPGEQELSSDLEAARPQTAGEEELQLQLALAMSREEAEQEETKNKSDDIRLQLALQKSKENCDNDDPFQIQPKRPSNDLLDLVDINFGNPKIEAEDPWALSRGSQNEASRPIQSEAFAGSSRSCQMSSNPWSPVQQKPEIMASPNGPFGLALASSYTGENDSFKQMGKNDPWNPLVGGSFGGSTDETLNKTQKKQSVDPWSLNFQESPYIQPRSEPQMIDPFSPTAQKELHEFDLFKKEMEGQERNQSFDANYLAAFEIQAAKAPFPETGARPKKSVASIIEEHSNLVNLDNLLATKPFARNPFDQNQANPFQSSKSPKPAMNQLLGKHTQGPWSSPSPSTPKRDADPFF